eukprot:scaffold9445_cov59-Phaeocystis_antarctica.AAC.6
MCSMLPKPPFFPLRGVFNGFNDLWGSTGFWRGPALGGFFTEAPDTSPIRRPSAAPTRFTFASRPPAVGESYAARQAA